MSWRYLTSLPKPLGGEVQWNFQKYLVDRDGKVIGKFAPATNPRDARLIEQLEALLLDLDAGPVDVDVGGDDLLGDLDVGLEEGLGRLAHRGLDLTADGGEVAEDGVELLVEDVTHGLHLRRAG